MADNYKIKVKVEIVRCPDAVSADYTQTGIGHFEPVISSEQGQSIDACEQMLLQTNYAALRDAFAHHLSAASRQHALEVVESVAECDVKSYRVDGELGRIMFDTYQIEPGQPADGTVRALFPPQRGKEWYRTAGFKEIGLIHGTVQDSYRKTSAWLNRIRHQAEGTPTGWQC